MLRIDLYSAAGVKLDVPPLEGTAIAGFSYSGAEKKIGSFTLSVPLGEAMEVQSGRRIWAYTDEGLIFKGQIDSVETVIQGETKMVQASGMTLARLKLGKKTTLNRRFDNASLSTILSALLSGTGYSAGSVDVPLTNLTIPLFGNTLWDALGKIADGFGYLMREDVINDTIDMGAFGDNSGLTFGNAEAHTPGLSANPDFAVITGLKVKARTHEVYNKIIPLGQQQSIASTANAPYLTLENSTRTSPYTVQTGLNPDGTTYWYISDATSVATHGECEMYFPVSFVAPLSASTTDLQRAANTLYDLAVTHLQRVKDQQIAYEVDVVGLKHRAGGEYTFEVGQKCRLQYTGAVTTDTGREVLLEVDEDLYIMEYQRTFDASGADMWRLTVSSISRIIPGMNDFLADFVTRLTGQQVVPIPFIIFGDNVARFAPSGLEFVCPTNSGIIGAQERSITWYDDATFTNVRGRLFAAYNSALSTSYFMHALRPAVDGMFQWGFYDFGSNDWDFSMVLRQLDGGVQPFWGLVDDAGYSVLGLSPGDNFPDDYDLYIMKNGAQVKVGGTIMPSIFGVFSPESVGGQLTALGETATSNPITGFANQTVYVPLVVQETVTIVKAWWINGNTVSGNVDIGLYPETGGAKVVSLGSTAQSGASSIQEGNIADTIVPAGRYLMALGWSSATATFLSYSLTNEKARALGLAGESTFALPSSATPVAFSLSTHHASGMPVFGFSLRTLVA